LDSLSQAVLGASVGYAVAGKRFGRIAVIAGAVAGTIPDLDSFFPVADEFESWVRHRGISHSFAFAAIAGPALGWIVWRAFRQNRPFTPPGEEDALGAWIALFTLGIGTHPLLDWFTIYGTQLLAPFSDARFFVPGLGIIDPGYTVPLLIGTIAALAAPRALLARFLVFLGLGLSTVYLFYGLAQNQAVEKMARAQLRAENVVVADVRVYTTIFQPWLRRIVVEDPEGARVGFASTWQKGAIAWRCFKRVDDPAFAPVLATREGKILSWFSDGMIWPTVETKADGGKIVRITDRRYGVPGETVNGWWGLEAQVDAANRVTGTIERIQIPRDLSRIGELFDAGFGKPTEIFPQARDAAEAARSCVSQRG
jgi:inner membrane protein